MKFPLISLLALLGIPSLAYAQSPSKKKDLSEVVISGTRSEVQRHKAPVIVNRIDARMLERVQAVSLAEGLAFSPGLRVENNCQNCGFSQVRMNGLSGPYTQILLNGRPVFSALAGIYGLEQLPSAMVDRIEVVRSGGSVLYGGNAIAGTINIISRVPHENELELGSSLGILKNGSTDWNQSAWFSLIEDSIKTQFSGYVLHRDRQSADFNGDGFSEMTKLENTTLGLDARIDLGKNQLLKVDGQMIQEFRRGGSQLDLQPHEAAIAEQLKHRIFMLSGSYEWANPKKNRYFSLYSALRRTLRDSYYGSGGRVIQPGDSLTEQDRSALNAYGNSSDWALNTGLQWSQKWNSKLETVSGAEYTYQNLLDRMLGYGREINQSSHTLGSYSQSTYQIHPKWQLLGGLRLDYIQFNGSSQQANFQLPLDRSFWVLVPRLGLTFSPTLFWKWRLGYAQGYRAPAVFDEDLHVESVKGRVRFVRWDASIQTEKSHSLQLSSDWMKYGENSQFNLITEVFFTRLSNPYLYTNPVFINGLYFITKRNGGGAQVFGTNLEFRYSYGRNTNLSLGMSLQKNQYDDAESVWTPDSVASAKGLKAVTTLDFLRSPNVYGYFSFERIVAKRWTIALSGVYTGSMKVPHVVGVSNASSGNSFQYTRIQTTPDFLEINLKISRSVWKKGHYEALASVGINNLTDAFQSDFDRGIGRDAAYIYGPMRPRMLFLSLKWKKT